MLAISKKLTELPTELWESPDNLLTNHSMERKTRNNFLHMTETAVSEVCRDSNSVEFGMNTLGKVAPASAAPGPLYKEAVLSEMIFRWSEIPIAESACSLRTFGREKVRICCIIIN